MLVAGGQITLTNNFISNNQAPEGSGLYLFGTSAWLTHTTLVGNASGTGIVAAEDMVFSIPSILTMTNSILARHAVGIYASADTTVTLEATLWGTGAWSNTVGITNPTNWEGKAGNVFTGTLNLWGDPKFVSPATGNYHLHPDSPAKDVGIDAGVYTDIDGEPRPMGLGFDIGADEVLAAPPQKVYLPLVVR